MGLVNLTRKKSVISFVRWTIAEWPHVPWKDNKIYGQCNMCIVGKTSQIGFIESIIQDPGNVRRRSGSDRYEALGGFESKENL